MQNRRVTLFSNPGVNCNSQVLPTSSEKNNEIVDYAIGIESMESRAFSAVSSPNPAMWRCCMDVDLGREDHFKPCSISHQRTDGWSLVGKNPGGLPQIGIHATTPFAGLLAIVSTGSFIWLKIKRTWRSHPDRGGAQGFSIRY